MSQEIKILCVDDIDENLFTIREILRSHYKSAIIKTSKSAKEALGLLLGESFDVILLDVMMPDIDGFEAAKLIKSNKKTKDIPIIFVTAKKDNNTITSCFSSGGSDYISKPINKEELLARIDFHLKLQNSIEKIRESNKFINEILDAQESMIAVVKDRMVIKANAQLMNFFNFQKDNINPKEISKHFLKIEGYYYPGDDVECWVEDCYQKQKNDDFVGIISIEDIKDFSPKSFITKIVKIDNQYILSFTDITLLDIKLHKFRKLATYDNLTKVYNRRTFDTYLNQAIIVAKETKETFTFVILDIDHFKKVNDTYGHLMGDEVLVNLSKVVKRNIRSSDRFGRWGGEEFVLLLDKASAELSKDIIEHLRKKIEKEYFKGVGHITCSFGLTEYIEGDTVDKITKRADEALYEAKEGGRNRVCLA